ncbi:MAG: helix-turn-helix domain-containing protein [Sulfuricella sp.]
MAKSTKSDPKKIMKTQVQQEAFERLIKEAELIDREVEEIQISNKPRFGAVSHAPENDLGRRLEESRRAKGLTQGELAEQTKLADQDGKGLSRSVISLYELGTNRPGPKELRLLCEVLRVSPSFLIYGDDDPFENFTERKRYEGYASSEPEFYAKLTYCFSRLHHHHKLAIMSLMMGLLRGWNKGFDVDLDKLSNDKFLQAADKLRLLLGKRDKQKEK